MVVFAAQEQLNASAIVDDKRASRHPVALVFAALPLRLPLTLPEPASLAADVMKSQHNRPEAKPHDQRCFLERMQYEGTHVWAP